MCNLCTAPHFYFSACGLCHSVCWYPLQWQHSLLGIMRGIGMLLVGTMVGMVTPLDLGYGGLPGQRTPRTGVIQ